MEASLLALEDRGKGRRSCGLTRTAIIVAACPALLAGGGCWSKEPTCLRALCKQSTLYFNFLFTLFIFDQSKEEVRIALLPLRESRAITLRP